MIVLINIVIVLLLVMVNGFFVAAEFAMVKVRKSRIETLVLDGNINAKYTQKVVNDLNEYLSACQLGITLASLGLGWVGEPAVSKLLTPIFEKMNMSQATVHSVSFILAFSLITGLHIVIGELAPKSFAIVSSEKVALFTALPLIMFYKITYPIMWAFNHSTNFILKLFGISLVGDHDIAHTDEEIKLLVEESYKHGLIDKTELTFVDNIFDFSEKTVKEIMIHRTDMVCLFKEDSFSEIVETALKEELTRYPVCNENKDNIIGFIHIKDLYKQKIEGNNENIEGIIRNIKFVPKSMSIGELFKVFQKEKEQIAIVIDEFGGTSGLVTIEDILEEIVGEIQDEFDDEVEGIKENEDGSYLVDGKTHIEDINELLNIDIYDEDLDTIGGFIYSQLEGYPKINDIIIYNDYKFIILKGDRKRISKLLIKR